MPERKIAGLGLLAISLRGDLTVFLDSYPLTRVRIIARYNLVYTLSTGLLLMIRCGDPKLLIRTLVRDRGKQFEARSDLRTINTTGRGTLPLRRTD